jgi:signal transduction histidine kinase
MQSKILIKCLLLAAFKLFVFSSAQAQTDFSSDSLKIIENANKLISQKIKIQDQDSLVDFIGKDIQKSTALSDDLIQFYLARHYFMRQNLSDAIIVAHKNIEDNYNSNYSDAKFYNIKGAVHTFKKEYNNAIEAFLKAAKEYQSQGNILREHVVYSNIANIYLALGDHQQAYYYSQLCFSEYRGFPQDVNYLNFLGILIICENNVNMLDSAKIHIDMGLNLLDSSNNIQGKAVINFATSEWEYKNENYHKALPFALKSLKMSETYQLKQFQIMNSILLMEIHNKLKEFSLALKYGLIAKENLKYYNNLSMQHSISNGLATAYAGLGDFNKAYLYKNETDSLKTIDRDEVNKRNIDRLLIQFEALKNKNKILGQEATIAIQINTIDRRNNTLIFGGFAVLFLVLFIIGIFVFNRQRLKLLQNKQEVKLVQAISASEEAERSRISSELHDGLAAELTALKLELEQNESSSERAFTMLNKAHLMTRRISHNLSPFLVKEKGLVEAVAYMVNNNNINNKLHFYTNISEPINLDAKVETILYRSIQELLQNSLKHSNASEIVVQVLLNVGVLSVSVEDNGVGMEKELVNNSIGLGSLKKRIELINGNLEIDSSPDHGTTTFINLRLEV